MKSKIYSILVLFVAVLFMGAVDAESSQTIQDDQPNIVDQFEEISESAVAIADAKAAGQIHDIVQDTQREIKHFLPAHEVSPEINSVGNIDYQIIELYPGQYVHDYQKYRPRSNLGLSGLS